MHSQLFWSLGLVSLALAAAQFDLDRKLEGEVVQDVNQFVSTLVQDPELQTLDIPAIEKIVPTTAVQAAATDPAKLIEAIIEDETNTQLIASLPSNVIASLRKLLAKPLKAVADIAAYIQLLLASPGVQQGLSYLEQAVPASVQQQIKASPIAFLENLVTATTVPAYVAALPTSVQKDLASILNQGFSIIEADFEDSKTGTAPRFRPTGASLPYITATAVGGHNGTATPTPTRRSTFAGIPPITTATGGASISVGGQSGGGASSSPIVAFKGGAARNVQALGVVVVGGVVAAVGMFAVV